jgi:hypothetical protein
MSKKVKKELDNIRDSCDEIEDELDVEDKEVSTRGDPVVRFH